MAAITDREAEQVQQANASGRQPVVFVHGLWLLPSSWDRWAALFADAGYATLTPAWPDDPETVAQAASDPEVFAHKTIQQVVDHLEQIARALNQKPVAIGHSFGGLFVEMLAGRGTNIATVAISPVGFQGVLPVPPSTLKSTWPVLSNPANRDRAVTLTFEQFRYAFANAVDEAEAHQLYDDFAVPGAGMPLFQAIAANLNPWTEAKVERNSARGPMLVIAGEHDHTIPPAIAKASHDIEQRDNDEVTEYIEIPGRGHALTIDAGWREVAQTSLAFAQRFAPAGSA
jgi:non-heme chloroperoxidase